MAAGHQDPSCAEDIAKRQGQEKRPRGGGGGEDDLGSIFVCMSSKSNH